jgi:uncharacterized protein YcbX
MHGNLVVNTQMTVKMDNWSVEHHVACVEFFVKTESVTQMQCNFLRKLNVHRAPCNIIKTWVSRWCETGNVRNIQCPGQQPSVYMPENIERIRNAVVRNPQRSVQQQASALGMSD